MMIFHLMHFHIDIDECKELTNNCSQICTDLPGTYNCSCYGGYIKHLDGFTCIKGRDEKPPEQKVAKQSIDLIYR